MRNYIFYSALLLLVGFMSFNWKSAAEKRGLEYTGQGAEVYEDFAGGVTRYTFTADTITDTENDTLTLPYNVFSSYSSLYQFTRTNLSGTTDVTVTVEQSALVSGSDWVVVATSSGSGATNEGLVINPTAGLRYRVILDGDGTQSTRYTCEAVLKKQY